MFEFNNKKIFLNKQTRMASFDIVLAFLFFNFEY